MKKELIQHFIASALTNTQTDLYDYEDDDFCAELQLVSIDSIIFLLFQIKTALLKNKPPQTFSLAKELNRKHPQTKLSILDYCLVAGFSELATRAVSDGAGSDHLLFFKHRLRLHFDPYLSPQIVININELIDQLELTHKQRSSSSLSIDNQDQNTNLVNSFYSNHKYPAVFFSAGILGISGSIIVYPFLHGIASALLLSVGLPAIFSGVNSLQASVGGRDRDLQAELRDHLALEVRDLDSLINVAIKTKKGLEIKMLQRHLACSQPLIADQKKPMLFAFDKPKVVTAEAKLPKITESFGM